MTPSPASFSPPIAARIFRWVLLFFYVPFLVWVTAGAARVKSMDFPSFYWGARIAFVDHRSPYVPEAFTDAEKTIDQRIYPTLYPPPSLLLFYPLTKVSYPSARLAMLAANQVCLLLLAYLVIVKILGYRVIDAIGAPLPAAMLLYLVAASPVVETLQFGQVNLIATACICLAWLACRQRRAAVWIAIPLAFAVLLKTYPVLLLGVLLLRRRYGAAVLTIALLAATTAVAAFVLPHAAWSDWAQFVLPAGGYGRTPIGLFSPAAMENQSLNGFVSRLLIPNEFNRPLRAAPGLAGPLGYLLSGICVLVTGWACIRSNRNFPSDPRSSNEATAIDREFSLALLAIYLVAPFSWLHHLVFILPAGLLIFRDVFESRRFRLPQVACALSLLLIAWVVPVWWRVLASGVLILLISVKLYAVLTLWMYLTWRTVIQTRMNPSP